ncbi:MAG: hypothetical protein CME88_04025 [Hirschia sp.]|nr:hypothetical protein [Hirschia sp.]MBB35524.1 hypothetical protein [Hirschia sp.]MBF17526.1 hypothetical protein [Hirschia sp.]
MERPNIDVKPDQIAQAGFQPFKDRWLTSIVLGAGFYHLFIWAADWTQIMPVSEHSAYLAPSSALSFCLLAIALFWTGTNSERSNRLTAILGLTGAVMLMAMFNWTAHHFQIGADIDQQLFGNDIKARMADTTALLFMFSAVSIILLRLGGSAIRLAHGVATIGLLITVLMIIAYVLNASSLYEITIFKYMSIWTSICFLCLFILVHLQDREQNWIWLIVGPGDGAKSARRMLPVMIITPIFLSWLVVKGSRQEIFDSAFRLSLLSFGLLLILVVIVLYSAHKENSAAAERQKLVDDLSLAVKDRDLLLREVHHRVKNNLQQINAMLYIQTATLSNERAQRALSSMSKRIEALGVVQRLLLQSPTIGALKAPHFVDELVSNLAKGYGGEERQVEIQQDIDHIDLDLDGAVTVGLIINELVSNCFKYGVENAAEGETVFIRVALKSEPDAIALTVADCYQPRAAPKKEVTEAEEKDTGIGQIILKSFVSQLDGEMFVSTNESGYSMRISFPDHKLRPAP